MWKSTLCTEVGKTIRVALNSWAKTGRLVSLLAAVATISWILK